MATSYPAQMGQEVPQRKRIAMGVPLDGKSMGSKTESSPARGRRATGASGALSQVGKK